uniref:Delta-5 fatty acid desaturase 2 protein n=1 Tax=Haliotis discus discus TaxID=91233 RepID=A0A7I6J246_HALDI|nr:delta-5 fatty acid desaturase 2 protein [Haliotis discus discus]
MGKGGQGTQNGISKVKDFSMDDVKHHDKRDDKWLVIQGEVYNITDWARRHPGGSKVISHYAGQDATDAFRAFHNDLSFVKKYLKPIHIGSLREETKETEVERDFRELRATAEKMNLFKPNALFFVLHLGHILLLEYMAYAVMAYFGTGWIPYILSLVFYSTVQAQSGWLQHDFGHISVFKNRYKLDHLMHLFTMGVTKGASPQWWNHMHYQHHAKPNVMNKDPDVRVEELFVVGKVMPVQIAKERKKSMPYNWQHRYFFLIGPPLLFPVYFQYMLFRHIFTRKAWWDLLSVSLFFVKFFYLYIPMLGIGSTIIYYFIMRCLESHWFTWVSQSNHIPMDIEEDSAKPWLALQLHATCNVEQSFFNDWFTGHLNFQIEHHLFPTMPRHNLHKMSALVRSVCEKHNIPYKIKPLGTAFADIVRTLKHSGELWYSTYNAFHSP